MTKFLCAALLYCMSFSSFSAQSVATPEAYASRAELIEQYQLNEPQIVELDRILEQRRTNLDKLGRYANQDAESFWTKRRHIYHGEMGSLRMILRTPEQLEAFRLQQVADRRAQNDRVRELMAAGHDREAARILMLQRY